MQTITSSLNDATHPGTLVSNVQNGPNGPLGYNLGNGLTNVSTRDALGRLNGGSFCSGSSAFYCVGGMASPECRIAQAATTHSTAVTPT